MQQSPVSPPTGILRCQQLPQSSLGTGLGPGTHRLPQHLPLGNPKRGGVLISRRVNRLFGLAGVNSLLLTVFQRPGQVLEVRRLPRGSGSLRGTFLSSSSLLTGRYLRKIIDFTGAQFPEGLFGTNHLFPEKSLWEGAAGAGLT